VVHPRSDRLRHAPCFQCHISQLRPIHLM
jgi:hypothetical protein